MVNEVASPSKFSEFACMGLFVIHNGTVNLAKEYIMINKAGVIIDVPRQVREDAIIIPSLEIRKQNAKVGRKYFGIENIALSYLNNYNRIIENPDRLRSVADRF